MFDYNFAEQKLKNTEEPREKRKEARNIWFILVYLFNGILIPFGIINAKIWFIRKYLIVTINIFRYSIGFSLDSNF